MIYKIDNKYYIKVQGYYKEVDISIKGNNLDIKPNGNEIEASNTLKVETFDMRMDTQKLIKELSANKPREEKRVFSAMSGEEQRERRNSRRRM